MWQDISTAPKDGTVIDLWMVNERGEGWRVTDAYFVKDRDWTTAVWTDHGWDHRNSVTIKRDGWWAPHQDYDDMPGWCDVPEYFNPVRSINRVQFEKPSHWMPLPTPPGEG